MGGTTDTQLPYTGGWAHGPIDTEKKTPECVSQVHESKLNNNLSLLT